MRNLTGCFYFWDFFFKKNVWFVLPFSHQTILFSLHVCLWFQLCFRLHIFPPGWLPISETLLTGSGMDRDTRLWMHIDNAFFGLGQGFCSSSCHYHRWVSVHIFLPTSNHTVFAINCDLELISCCYLSWITTCLGLLFSCLFLCSVWDRLINQPYISRYTLSYSMSHVSRVYCELFGIFDLPPH